MEICPAVPVGCAAFQSMYAAYSCGNRDHDELRYSLRSVLANFRPYLGSFHLLATDFAIPDTAENITVPIDYRLGQVPQWLNVEQRPWADGHVDLSIKHHAQIFHPYEDNIFNR